VAAETNAGPRHVTIDQALATWRQGDCVLGEHWFVLRLDPSLPVTDAARTAAAENGDLAEEQVVGLVVVTQTCDIVRSYSERPFIEVCPLVEVDEEKLHDIERGRRPAYGFVPELANQRLIADLDRTMTVEKPVVAKWTRTPGWSTDAQARAFAAALARKRARFAFPDDFTTLVAKLQGRLSKKHDKTSPEGDALRRLREIRVHAAPSWDDKAVTLTFWFVRNDEDVTFEGKNWAACVGEWLKLIPEGGRFVKVQGQVTTLEDLTAADYVESDPLDLDHLSSRTPKRDGSDD
jgi:hypothetical protein